MSICSSTITVIEKLLSNPGLSLGAMEVQNAFVATGHTAKHTTAMLSPNSCHIIKCSNFTMPCQHRLIIDIAKINKPQIGQRNIEVISK